MQPDTIEAIWINAYPGDVLRHATFVMVCHDMVRLGSLAFSTATNATTFHSVNLGANLSLVNSPTRLSLASAFELPRFGTNRGQRWTNSGKGS